MAYYRAACHFFAWVEEHQIGELADIEPIHVAAYIEAFLSRRREELGLRRAQQRDGQHPAPRGADEIGWPGTGEIPNGAAEDRRRPELDGLRLSEVQKRPRRPRNLHRGEGIRVHWRVPTAGPPAYLHRYGRGRHDPRDAADRTKGLSAA
jgi:hypothetical protein